MSCLNVAIRKLGESLALMVKRIGGIAVEIHRCDAPMQVTYTDVGKHLIATCGIVCDVGNSHILKVSPEEGQVLRAEWRGLSMHAQ